MEDIIVDLIEQWGYIAVLLLIFAENIFPPIPSEIILTAGGYLTTTTNLTVGGVIIASVLGSYLGAVVLYVIGSYFNQDTIKKIANKTYKYLRIKEKNIDKVFDLFQKFGVGMVFICRLIPVLRSLISIPAGMAKMKFLTFSFFTLLGTTIWNTILILVGKKVGENSEAVLEIMGQYSSVIKISLVLAVIIGLLFVFIKKIKKIRA